MVFLFDLDGTLALNDHRQHLLECSPRKWDEWSEACVLDMPNRPLLWLLEIVSNTVGQHAYIITGRDENQRAVTRDWLCKYAHPAVAKYVPLIMRPDGNHTEDTKLKAQWFEVMRQLHLDQEFVAIEDRSRMVRMWRSLGVQCWQVAEGNF